MRSAVPALLSLVSVSVTEAVRDKLFSVLGFFAVGLVLLSIVLSQLALGWPARIVADLAFASVSIVGTVAAAALPVRFVGNDFQRRTLYPILCRPNPRAVYLLGRYLGIVGAIALLTVGMWAMTLGAILLATRGGGPQITVGETTLYCAFACVRFAIVAAVALLLLSVASTTLAFVGSLSFAVAAHASADVNRLLSQSDSEGVRFIGRALHTALPDFTALNPLAAMVHDAPMWSPALGAALVYGALYALALLLAATVCFEKRDLA